MILDCDESVIIPARGLTEVLVAPNGRVIKVTADVIGVGYRVEVQAHFERGMFAEGRWVDYPRDESQLNESLSGIWKANKKRVVPTVEYEEVWEKPLMESNDRP